MDGVPGVVQRGGPDKRKGKGLWHFFFGVQDYRTSDGLGWCSWYLLQERRWRPQRGIYHRGGLSLEGWAQRFSDWGCHWETMREHPECVLSELRNWTSKANSESCSQGRIWTSNSITLAAVKPGRPWRSSRDPVWQKQNTYFWIDQLTSFLSTWLLKVGYNPLDEGNVFEILNNSMERNIGLTVNG